ncbi:neisseria PilC protein [mine drainage metagenome]|uniref:Neisseria PilC protein n=1 Tax=mine drainage metagenome TaxID=410659 RepID=A0A1J5S5W7_9ZZZZ
MNTIRFFLACMFIALLGNPARSLAEDIDLYSSTASVTGNLPNVLFILDNAANFNANSTACTYTDTGASPSLGNTTGGIEQCALNNAIYALPVQANGSAVVNIGIMVYNKTGMTALYGCNASATAGCLMSPLTPMTAAGKAAIMSTIKAWTSGNVQSNNEATAQAMQEAWAYYAGKTGMSGTTYTSPALSGCQKNFVIFIGNAINNSGSPSDASATPGTQLTTTINGNTALTSAQQTLLNTPIQIPSGAYGMSTFTCSPNPYTMGLHTQPSGLYADEWARYMYDTDLASGAMPANKRITTYTIGVLSSACKADYPALLTSMAIQGGGKYFPTGNGTDIQQAILRILNEVQAVNSVFSSSSLPVSVNSQGTYLNQVFMGMFRPDALGAPRWKGNLKQYQFAYDQTTQQLFLADATGSAAISSAGTGFLSPNAASFWSCSNSANTTINVTPYNIAPYSTTSICNTDPAVGFWANSPNGVGLSWDLPDGEVVEKGGAAQMLRLPNLTDTYTTTPGSSTNPRNFYTYCPSGTSCVSSLSNPSPNPNVFDTSNVAITDAMLGTGPVAISSIIVASTVQASGVIPSASSGGTTATISITALSKSGNTVTAAVSATDLAKLAVGTQLNIAVGATKYNCNPCSITAVYAATNTFTYTNSGGSGTPTLPSTATIYSNFVTVTSYGNSLPVGQTVTLSACTTYTALNGTIGTVSTVIDANHFMLATTLALAGTTSDTGCQYTPNTATVTTATAHNFPNGAAVTIAGAGGTTTAPYSGLNGNWVIAVTGTNTFTYQYTALAPLSNFGGSGATTSRSNTTRDALLRWVRGEDNYGDEASLCPPGTTTGTGNCPNPAVNIRPSVHGDVLHSRPVVLNYGGVTITITATSDSGSTRTANASVADVANIGATGAQANVTFANGNICMVTVASSTTFTYPNTGCGAAGAQTAATATPNVVVFYGDNDGTFHAVNGNQVNPAGSTLPNPGGELWGFIPSEFFGKLLRQHDNSPVLLMPSTPPGIIPTPKRKDYFVDGPTGIYQVIDGLGKTTTAYLYLAMRRGGRFIYALDVTNPGSPKFLWKHSNADAGFGELGQTWSQPKVAMVSGYPSPVLIFGAGYDNAAEDVEPPASDTMGRGIFILDATTGALVWNVSPNVSTLGCTTSQCQTQVTAMKYSIPSDITLLDRNYDGKIDRLYVGDVGGNVWRVDLEPANGNTPNFWQVEKLAALGCGTGPCAAGTTPRKILYPPEVISTSFYDAVFTATGDREHPLYSDPTLYPQNACAITNRAYLLKDLATGMDGSGQTTITEQPGTTANLFDATSTTYNGTLRGYYVTFNPCEKSVNAPLVTAGYVYFGTNTAEAPNNQACQETLGEATGYKLAPFTGNYVTTEFAGGGLPPSPVSGIVNIATATGTTVQVPFCIGCTGQSALAGSKPPISVSTNRSRTYWYIKDK